MGNPSDAEWDQKYRQERTIHLKGDIIITDPCYLMRSDADGDWERCDMGANMEVLGIQNYLVHETTDGDWACKTVDDDTYREIGRFCADAGLVGVFLLSEVLAYNPQYKDHLATPHACTLIKDFDGTVTIKVVAALSSDENENEQYDKEVRVLGRGNVNFYTTEARH